VTVWEVREGTGRRALGGATLALFSKKGRLKAGRQDLRLWEGAVADTGCPPSTPGRLPSAQRGEAG
jgi:phosphatidylinositol 3-kinase